jgi:hypothetical protein
MSEASPPLPAHYQHELPDPGLPIVDQTLNSVLVTVVGILFIAYSTALTEE